MGKGMDRNMNQDFKVEIIYFNTTADWMLESGFYGDYPLRLLTQSTGTRQDFLKALSRGVSRSEIIVTVGGFFDGGLYLPGVLAKSVGRPLEPVNYAFAGFAAPKDPMLLPSGALPLFSSEGTIGGCLMESGGQAIIMLADNRQLRMETARRWVYPYLEERRKAGLSHTAAPVPPAAAAAPSHASPNAPAGRSFAGQPGTAAAPSAPAEYPPTAFAVSAASAIPVKASSSSTAAEPVPAGPSRQPEPGLPDEDEPVFFGFDSYPVKKRSVWKVLRVIIILLLIAGILLGGWAGYDRFFLPMQADRVYSEAGALHGKSGTAVLPPEALEKFGALYGINSDFVGWLTCPNTRIDYPVVSAAGKPSGYYRSHLFDKSFSPYGTPYTEASVTSESYVRNLTIYGNDTGTGRLFSNLRNYLNPDFLQSSGTITMDTLYSESTWKIFSVFSVAAGAEADYARNSFFDDSDYLHFISSLYDRSQVPTGVELTADDEILTLVSSGVSDKIVVAARKVRYGEDKPADAAPQEEAPSSGDTESSSEISSPLPESSQPESASSQSAAVANTVYTAPPAKAADDHQTPPISESEAKDNADVEEPPPPTPGSGGSSGPEGALRLSVKNQSTGKVVTGSIVEIISGVIEAEMGSGYHIEALKAQAVASYSWLLCNGAAKGKTPSVPMKTPGSRAIEAAKAVEGQRALYNGSVAQTYYYAISAGKTANSQDIWTAALPYLVSVDSSVDKNASGYQTIVSYAASDVAKWVQDEYGLDLTAVGDKNSWFETSYDENGLYVRTVTLGGTLTRDGPELRSELFVSSRVGSGSTLRSSAYSIAYSQSEDRFIFTVKGYGHGVGMSQVGANAYAKSGWGYEQILTHYYPGITIG